MLVYTKSVACVWLVLAAFFGFAPLAEADNWINLFDRETLFGWTVFGDGKWKAGEGGMSCEGGSGGWIATTGQFADFELATRVRVSADNSIGVVVRGGLEGHTSSNGSTVLLVTEPKEGKGDWHDVTVKAVGTIVNAAVDGKEVQVEAGHRLRGHIGFQYYGDEAAVAVAHVRLRPLNTKPVFNGRDLTGWNIIPGHKSEFKVVDGALNIKNGEGQIETAGIYKDFVLQLDVFVNGDHLNSGVFFHGLPGQFWKGYECQIRNEWKPEGRNFPVDFGTGGLYGAQSARKVVSSDREWFTVTIECNDNHVGIWVNGYLVSDFIDTRPESEDNNGINGYVPGPGTLHLQGHDPTTDLSFKNIVVEEYGATVQATP